MLSKIKQNKEIVYSVALIVLPLTLLFVAIYASRPDIDNFRKNYAATATELSSEEDDFLAIVDTFKNIEVRAKSAIVKDLRTGDILFAKNEDIALPLASITKVLTVLTATINSDSNVVGISPAALETEGNSGLVTGEKFYKKDLINLTLISSSNDGAAALALDTFNVSSDPQRTFVDEMNRVARDIGMKNSYFYNETGLDNDQNIAGAHGTAEDVAVLFEYVLSEYPEIIEFTKEDTLYIKSLNGLIHATKNTNDIVGKLPNTLASKTGYTDIAGGNLAVVIDPALNNPVAIVVLGSTEKGRFDDVEKLAKGVTEYYKVNY